MDATTEYDQNMSDTLLRQWTMLRAVPRYPRRIGTAQLQ